MYRTCRAWYQPRCVVFFLRQTSMFEVSLPLPASNECEPDPSCARQLLTTMPYPAPPWPKEFGHCGSVVVVYERPGSTTQFASSASSWAPVDTHRGLPELL